MSGRSERNSWYISRVARASRPTDMERVAVLQRLVSDARRLEPLGVGPGCRRAHHLVARRGERPQLRAEQQLEAHVGGGDVDDLRLRHDEGGHRGSGPIGRPPHGVLQPRPPSTLAWNHRMPSATWIGERAAPRGRRRRSGWHGCRRWPPRRSGRAPARRRGGAGQRLGVGEVASHRTGPLADQLDRAVELAGDRGRRRAGPAARGCGCGSRGRGSRWRQRRRAAPRGDRTLVGEVPPSSTNSVAT
jgi:hypothetical protein